MRTGLKPLSLYSVGVLAAHTLRQRPATAAALTARLVAESPGSQFTSLLVGHDVLDPPPAR